MLLSRKSAPESESYKAPDEKGASDESGSYDELANELGDILGLDEEKAHRLRDVICSLAREEIDGGGSEESSDEAKKPTGLAILLKKGG